MNVESILEKVERAANLIEIMYIAKQVGDDDKFKQAHESAGKLLFDAARQLEEPDYDNEELEQ